MNSYKPLSREDLIQNKKCCGGGCTNCPYFPKHTRGSTELFIIPSQTNCYPTCSLSTMQEGLCWCYLDYIENIKLDE